MITSNETHNNPFFDELNFCFKEFIISITQIYPKLTPKDIIYYILSISIIKVKPPSIAWKIPSEALRTRKVRLKENMAEDTFRMIFQKGER